MLSVNRRDFLKQGGTLAGAMLLGGWAHDALAEPQAEHLSLTILHTNDTHSHLDPFPAGDRNAGRGGVVNRAGMIKAIREQQKNVLLFDAGDIFQGTPYFNLFHGVPEVEAMSLMGYNATTLGNHDFDGGMKRFADVYHAHGRFDVLVANYNVANTPLADIVRPYRVYTAGGLRVGVFGLGISPAGLIPLNLFEPVQYIDPFATASRVARQLRHDERCSLVICLSHLGYRMQGQPDDLHLAAATEDIDLIIGGHTHTFLPAPTQLKNRAGQPVVVNQVGFGGINLGRLDFTFDRISKKLFMQGRNLPVS